MLIELSEELYDKIMDELSEVGMYHWNDDSYHADDCYTSTSGELGEAWNEALPEEGD